MPMQETSTPAPPPGPAKARVRWRLVGWGFAAALILMPLVAMQFTEEVRWGPGDFLVFGAMLVLGGALLEFAVQSRVSMAYRAGVLVAVLTGFLLTWTNLAVGIIGDAENPANLMFFGVVLVAALGAVLARGRPAGMARAMVAAAVTQATVAIVAWSLGLVHPIVATGVFLALWLLAAACFGRSRRVPA